jgi:hypothetical protein
MTVGQQGVAQKRRREETGRDPGTNVGLVLLQGLLQLLFRGLVRVNDRSLIITRVTVVTNIMYQDGSATLRALTGLAEGRRSMLACSCSNVVYVPSPHQ